MVKTLEPPSGTREANATERVAKMIEETLLPQLEDQSSIDFDEGEALIDAVTRVVGSVARGALVRALTQSMTVHEGETQADAKARHLAKLHDFERLVGGIAEHAAAAVMPCIQESAERAYYAGITARSATPEQLAREAVQVVHRRQQG